MSKYNFDLNLEDDNIVSTMIKTIKKHSLVLEFGPSHGRLTKYLKEELECVVDIVEIDEESGVEASRYSRNALIGPNEGDINTFIWLDFFKNQKYDYIIFADVLEHLYHPERVLSSTINILNDDGLILISIPNISHNAVLINLYNNSFHYTNIGLLDDTHIHFWELSDFNRMATSAGYCMTNVKPFFLDANRTEQASFFPEDINKIELLFNNRPHGKIYQYFIQLNKIREGLKEYNINDLQKQPYLISLYFDDGSGFNEKQKTTDFIYLEKEFIKEIKFETNIESLRIDPVEGIFSKVNIEVALKDDRNCDFLDNNAIDDNKNGYYEFITNDPWFIIQGPFKRGQILRIKLTVNVLPIWEAIDRLKKIQLNLKDKIKEAQDRIEEGEKHKEELNRVLNTKGTEITSLYSKLIEKDDEITSLSEEINKKDTEVNSLIEELSGKNDEITSLNEELSEKGDEVVSLSELLDKKDDEITSLNEELDAKNTEITSLNNSFKQSIEETSIIERQLIEVQEQLLQLSTAYYNIINSKCWKITRPIRLILDSVKYVFHTILKNVGCLTALFMKVVRYAKYFGIRATCKKIGFKLFRYKRIKKSSFSPIVNNLIEVCEDKVETGKSVSIVIPTKNAGDEYELLLKNLINQKGFCEIEIVVVDSGSTDNTVEISRKYGATVVQIKPEEFSHSYSRNIGAQNATKEYLCVMTQDALPTSEYWLYHLYCIINNNPDVAAVSCAEYSRMDSDLYHRAFAWNHYKYLGALNSDAIMSMPNSNDPVLLRQNGQLSDITCFIKRETLLKYKYRGSFAEDLDLGMRLITDGYKLAFLGNEVSIHSHNRSPYYYLKRRFVELVTLKSIFADHEIINYRFDLVIKETAFLYYNVNKLLEEYMQEHIKLDLKVFREEFINRYNGIRVNCFPTVKELKKMDLSNKIDVQTAEFLDDCIKQYEAILTSDGARYSGLMIDAMEGYLNVVFDFMDTCYEVVDDEIVSEFFDCVFKILTSVIGTFFAYSYLSNDYDRIDHNNFYKALEEGV